MRQLRLLRLLRQVAGLSRGLCAVASFTADGTLAQNTGLEVEPLALSRRYASEGVNIKHMADKLLQLIVAVEREKALRLVAVRLPDPFVVNANGSMPWGGQGAPPLHVRMIYDQRLLDQLGVKQTQVVMLRFDPAGSYCSTSTATCS